MFTLDPVDDADCFFPRAAPGTIGHRAVARPYMEEFGECFFQEVTVPFLRFWGEKLKGDRRLPLRRFLDMNVVNESDHERSV